MASAASLAEYGEVIRVTPSQDYEVLKRDGYAFISERKPLAARQYCREMTLARGRILYEVWDPWTEKILGYIVPDEILNEAKAYRPGSALSPWPEEPIELRNLLQHAYDVTKMHFPRIPHVAAKTIAEDIQHLIRRRPITKRAVEDSVVEHIQHQWTSYEFRAKVMKQRKREVLDLIKPRVREVLQSWLPQYVSGEDTVELWRRQDLLDADDCEVEGGRWEDVAIRRYALTYYGGLETVANLGGW